MLIPNFAGMYGNTMPLGVMAQLIDCVRIGPEKGVIHIALGAVDNALWDMFARYRNKPLWKLVVDMTPVCTHATCAPPSPMRPVLMLCIASGGNRERYSVPLYH